jgi:hypothetical protein
MKMRNFFFVIATVIVIAAGAAACDDVQHSNFHDLGGTVFTHIGDPCAPDTPTFSQCGYPPQFYCTPAGICASTCNVDADCSDGASCVGAGDMVAGECRVTAPPTSGS